MQLKRPISQAGFTLVEVLVTIFVVAIGLLTATALQAISKKAAFDAMQRTTATVIAQDMLERIRSNSLQIDAYVTQGVEVKAAPATPTCGSSGGTACSAADLVTFDIANWWQALDGVSEQISEGDGSTASAGGLRSPVGCIRRTGAMVEVVIAWRGMTAITQASDGDPDDPTSDTCGASEAAYEPANGQSFRRVLRLQAHVRA
ncbi:MAG: type IV pilus modification protein PilV [Stagnimonas sp.]|nr:type IV pilus modification protein PilV [Stagnimonas sp.]